MSSERGKALCRHGEKKKSGLIQLVWAFLEYIKRRFICYLYCLINVKLQENCFTPPSLSLYTGDNNYLSVKVIEALNENIILAHSKY